MSKSLAEQIAELQDLFDKVCGASELRKQTIATLEAENAELRTEVRVMREQEVGVASACCERLPRVITAEELREGQTVTGRFPDGHWCEPNLVCVSELDPRRVLVIGDDGYYPAQFSPVVLLEDAE